MHTISYGSVAAQVKKLQPKSGDVVVFTVSQEQPGYSEMQEQLGRLAKELATGGQPGVLFVLLKPGETLDQMDEETMEKHGWTTTKPLDDMSEYLMKNHGWYRKDSIFKNDSPHAVQPEHLLPPEQPRRDPPAKPKR